MLDILHILNYPNANIQVFTATQPSVDQYQVWVKPRNARMVYMFGVGGGQSGSVGNGSTSGGTGGGSAAQTSLLIPAMFVPDILYVQVGKGGQVAIPAVSNAAAVNGTNTYVCIEPNPANIASCTFLAAFGGITTTQSAATIANMPFAARGFWQSVVGPGGAGAGSAATLQTNGAFCTSGAGGGTTSAGALSTTSSVPPGQTTYASNLWPTNIPGGTTTAGQQQGNPGFVDKYFLYSFGGSGGGSGTSGGVGGDGIYGVGGGGSSSFTGSPAAKSGDGGNGIVIIITT